MSNSESPWITGAELDKLIIALAEGSEERGFTQDRALALIRWAEEAVIQYSILQNILKGKVIPRWHQDDWQFKTAGQEW